MTDTVAALVDTNVLLDIFFDDPAWASWSVRCLETAALHGDIVTNDVVYAELSVRSPSVESLNNALARAGVRLVSTPRPALFAAGKAFHSYRARGGPRTSLLPDFFIGAHAAVLGVPLVTRDPRRYRTYFPKLELVAP